MVQHLTGKSRVKLQAFSVALSERPAVAVGDGYSGQHVQAASNPIPWCGVSREEAVGISVAQRVKALAVGDGGAAAADAAQAAAAAGQGAVSILARGRGVVDFAEAGLAEIAQG